jgi:hypothetical protein
MMTITSSYFYLTGALQLCVLIASAIVPSVLNLKIVLRDLPLLVRQLFWVYGGYVVLSILSLGLICLLAADDLAEPTILARAFCIYGALFWGIRLGLQPVLAAGAQPYLSDIRLKIGRHLLTLVFIALTLLYAVAAFR